ncbi:MAG: thioredoxin-disulfide reductase [Alphaproteobacteria bacterium]|nr:thioredoxin-disulfide reductase [Alphaproteobacteria bacterium]MBP3687270.1 thioredoxin-disulfide reductase [Alphaproteobacteria bacterium]
MALYTADLLILGSGPAGYTAGIYAARAGLNTMIVSGNQEGGQLTMTNSIENYPGFEEISGYELMDKMKQQALKLGVSFVNDNIVEVDFAHRPFVCSSENGHSYKARAVIVATGSSAKWLNIASEKKFLGYGVSACATCDGFFYRGRTVAVIGGGNSAAAEALYLATLADKVILVHRRHQLRADKILQDKIFNNRKITIEWDSVVEEILGEDEPRKVTGLKIRNVESDVVKELQADGIFVAVGHQPNTEIFKGNLVLDSKGYIVTHENCSQTDIEGVFAAGDVKDPKYKQAIISAGSGAKAAMDAIEYLDVE